MDTYVMVVCYWRSKVGIVYVEAQVEGASVGVGGCAIAVDLSIQDVNGG